MTAVQVLVPNLHSNITSRPIAVFAGLAAPSRYTKALDPGDGCIFYVGFEFGPHYVRTTKVSHTGFVLAARDQTGSEPAIPATTCVDAER